MMLFLNKQVKLLPQLKNPPINDIYVYDEKNMGDFF